MCRGCGWEDKQKSFAIAQQADSLRSTAQIQRLMFISRELNVVVG